MTTMRWALIGVLLPFLPQNVRWVWWHARYRRWPKDLDLAWLIAGYWTWGWAFVHFG